MIVAVVIIITLMIICIEVYMTSETAISVPQTAVTPATASHSVYL